MEQSYESKSQLEATKLTKWENEPTLAILEEDLAISKPSHDSHMSKVNEWRNIRDVTGKSRPKTRTNRSSVQPKLVRRQNEWRYSPLTEAFLSTTKMYNLSPETFEDVEAVKQNELLLNWQFRTKMNSVKFIDEMVRATVDDGTCAIRPGWKRDSRMVKKVVPVWTYYEIARQDQAEFLQQAVSMVQGNPRSIDDLPPDVRASVEYFMETGTPAIAEDTGTTEEIEEEEILKNHPTLDVIDIDNVYLDPACDGDILKARFAIIAFPTSQAELKKDGRYKNLDRVDWSNASPLHEPDYTTKVDTSRDTTDDLRKKVVAFEYWGFMDINKDGILVPIVATWVGNTLIRMEKNPYPDQEIPLVIIPYMPIRKSAMGEPDAELLKENQAIQGAVMRGMIDSMGRSANGQRGFSKGMLDVVNRRRYDRGDDYEFNPNISPVTGIHEHKYPELPASAMNMLQMQNNEAEALSGVKAFSGGLSADAYGDVARGIRSMLDAASKREMSILRRLGEGMEQIGRKLIAMNVEFLSEEEVVRVTNEEFVTIRREDLVTDCDIKVEVSSAEVDEAKAQDLGFMLQTLGNTVPWDVTKIILVEIAELKKMPSLAHKLEAFQPQPDPVAEAMKQLEVAELEAKIADLKAASMVKQAEAMFKEAKAMEAMASAREKGSSADLKDLNFVEQETGTTHARERDKLQQQSEGNERLEMTKHMLGGKKEEGKKPDIRDVADAVLARNMAEALTTS